MQSSVIKKIELLVSLWYDRVHDGRTEHPATAAKMAQLSSYAWQMWQDLIE